MSCPPPGSATLCRNRIADEGGDDALRWANKEVSYGMPSIVAQAHARPAFVGINFLPMGRNP